MPTLVWIRRPESGTGAAAGRDSARKVAAAIPDPVVSFAAPDPVGSAAVPDSAVSSGVALPAVSSNRINRFAGTDKERKKKRKKNHAKAATTAKKKSKTLSETKDKHIPREILMLLTSTA